MTMTRWIVTLALFGLLLPPARAQEVSAQPSQQEIVDSVLDLKRQIEELLAALPPEVRAELRRRLAEPPPASSTDVAEDVAPQPDVDPGTEPAVQAPLAHGAPPAEPAAAVAEASSAADAPIPTAPATEPAPSDGIPKLIKRRSRRAPCNTLLALDENGDGKLSSADRYWRYVYLWSDKNGDRKPQDREVQSAYEHRVREIAVSLETFVRAKGSLGEIRVEDLVVLDLRGDGFADRARRDDGILVVDASALARGDGPRLFGSGTEPLSGFIPFRSGLSLESAGDVTELNCP